MYGRYNVRSKRAYSNAVRTMSNTTSSPWARPKYNYNYGRGRSRTAQCHAAGRVDIGYCPDLRKLVIVDL